jgi:hypothetical protein
MTGRLGDMEEKPLKRIMASIKCTVCGQSYEADRVRVIGRREGWWFLSVACSACQTQCLVAAVVREDGAPEMVTDLTEAEWPKFREAASLTADEVLDMHNFLKDFRGDFPRLFGQK